VRCGATQCSLALQPVAIRLPGCGHCPVSCVRPVTRRTDAEAFFCSCLLHRFVEVQLRERDWVSGHALGSSDRQRVGRLAQCAALRCAAARCDARAHWWLFLCVSCGHGLAVFVSSRACSTFYLRRTAWSASVRRRGGETATLSSTRRQSRTHRRQRCTRREQAGRQTLHQ
jgi:hypothetical protein